MPFTDDPQCHYEPPSTRADPIGGVWTYALELSRALADEEMEIMLATMGAPLTPYQREAVRDLPNVRLEESEFRLEWMEDAWTDVERAGEWLLELEDRFRPDRDSPKRLRPRRAEVEGAVHRRRARDNVLLLTHRPNGGAQKASSSSRRRPPKETVWILIE